MKKAIVTGANGFVGSAVCKELVEQEIEVIAVVRGKESDISRIADFKSLRIVYCDLSEFRNLGKYIPDRDVNVMYHFAWAGSAGTLRGNDEVQLNNVKYTCDAVKACAKMKCKRFIFASSIMEYEISRLMNSDMIPGINTMYSSAKVAANYMARTIAADLNIEYIRALISNVYGPGEVSPRLINTSLRKLMSGEHCSFSPGEQLYDFIYISDAAKMFAAIGKNGICNKTYYIGSQKPRALKEFLCEMRDQVDKSISIGLGEIPFNGVSLSYHEFNINSVKEDMGFIPEVSFKDGIKKTLEWLKENN